MIEYSFKKDGHFDISIPDQAHKKGLEEVSSRKFVIFSQLEDDIIHYNAHVGKKPSELPPNFCIHTIPLTINRLPVYYEHPAGDLLIGHVEAREI